MMTGSRFKLKEVMIVMIAYIKTSLKLADLMQDI